MSIDNQRSVHGSPRDSKQMNDIVPQAFRKEETPSYSPVEWPLKKQVKRLAPAMLPQICVRIIVKNIEVISSPKKKSKEAQQ